MTITEIRDETDARLRLRDLYAIDGEEAAPYVQLLGLLCGLEGYPSFAKELERISELLWIEYRKPGMQDRPNRYSRSIINLANTQFGFLTQDNVVFAGPLSGSAFGKRVRNKVLWKDSFALGHGEFSHSYQWLTAGLAFNWGPQTGQHYANVAGRMSRVPVFAKDNDGMSYRRSPLWEYLVDCTRWQKWFDNEGGLIGAVNNWAQKQDSPQNPQELGARLTSYSTANVLTKDTFRSANNVATLAAGQDKWFISFYETRRKAVLKEAQRRGEAFIGSLVIPSMKASLEIATNGQQAITGYGDEHSSQYASRVNNAARRSVAHPIEAIKADRAMHYKLEKRDKGFTNPNKYVYERPITDQKRIEPKGQYWLEFHGACGFVNARSGLLV
ncbi:MAG: hypothetical protein WA777_03100 [Rhodanobacter sp.]